MAVFPEHRDELAVLAMLASVEQGDVDLDPGDVPLVASFLRDAPRTVRRQAGGALAAFARSNASGRALCESLLTNENPHVRWGAAYALGKAGLVGDAVIDVAVATLDDEDGDHRWAAARIVSAAARESDDLRARLRELAVTGGPRSRKMALLCLCDAGERDGAFYRSALGDEDAFVRLAALTSLGRSGDRSPQSLDAIEKVAGDDPDQRVRRGATAILAKLKNRGQAPN
jgi:HEAT repeat protein